MTAVINTFLDKDDGKLMLMLSSGNCLMKYEYMGKYQQ